MATINEIKKIYSSYFTPAAQSTSRVTPEIIQTILKLNKDDKIGSVLISEVLSEEPYNIKINQSQIGRILKTGRDNKLLNFIPRTEMKTSVDQRIYDDKSNRRIYKTIRDVREQDFIQYTGRGNKPPKDTKFKITFAYPDNPEKSVIPKKFQGTQYYKTKELAEEALKAENIFDARAERKIPFDNAVKQIHKIALKEPDEITSIKNLAKLVYGSDSIKDMTMVSNDIVRYQDFLLGFKTIPGLTIPPKNKLNDILSEFPSQSQWGKFASEELRRSKLKIRDALIDNKGTKLQTLRDNIVKLVNSKGLELDEAMGISATYERAPGYTELGQIIPKNINQLKNKQIDQPFGKLLERVVNGETGSSITQDIESFNKVSRNFQKTNKVDTAILTYKPGEVLNPSNFVSQFDKLSPEAQRNITDLGKKGIAVESNAAPMGDLYKRAMADAKVNGKICSIFRNKGGRIGFASGSGGCVAEVQNALDTDPVKFSQDINKLPEEAGAFNRVKSAASTFLNVAKKGGRFGAFAAVGAAGAGLVKQFTSDDPTSYLSDENQQKNMLIDMVTEPVMTETDPGITSSAQLPVLGAVTAAGAIPGGAEYYKDRRGIRPNDKFTGPMKQGVGKIRAAASPISGLLGKGLAATGTPLGMLALEPLYIGSQLAAGDSVGEIATNPLNYLGAAFAGPLTQQATKFTSPAVSSIMRLGISPTMLKTVSRRFGLPGLALSAGISGYEMYQNKKAGRGLFDDG